MVKKVYILPQTTVNKQFVMTQCLCVSKDERDVNYEGGNDGPGMGGGEGDDEGNFTKERGSYGYGNIW